MSIHIVREKFYTLLETYSLFTLKDKYTFPADRNYKKKKKKKKRKRNKNLNSL